ncbi:MAG: hypothetical protein ACI4AE_00375 [Candidatus Cryptobacteroides sp.]
MKSTLFKLLTGLTIAVLSLMGISSCNKEDSSDKNIVGKWQSTTISFKEYEAGKLVYEESISCIDYYLGFSFKDDGTGQVIVYDEGESDTSLMNWVIMGDKLMITETSSTTTFDIISINGGSMVLELSEEYTNGGIKQKDVSTITFKKI